MSPTLTRIVAAFGPQLRTVPWIVIGLLLHELFGPLAVSSTHGFSWQRTDTVPSAVLLPQAFVTEACTR